MAIGFPPRSSRSFPLGDMSPERLLALGVEAAESEGWRIGYVRANELVAYTGFSWRSWSEEVCFVVDSAAGTATIGSVCMGVQLIDFGKNHRNVHRLLRTMQRMYLTTDEALLDERYTALVERAQIQTDDLFNKPVANAGWKFKNFFSVFVPTRGYRVTPLLLYINVLVFAGMIITGFNGNGAWSFENLMAWGSNYRSNTFGGEAWRLLTCTFVHIGFMHLFFNMYALLYVGVVLEPVLGRTRFLAAYLASGILASAASAAWYEGVVAAGASGAIFGMYGLFFALLTTDLIERSVRRSMFISLAIFVGYALYNGLTGSGVDNAAHIGGLVSGALIGFLFYRGLVEPDETKEKYTTTAWTFIGALMLAAFAYVLTPVNSPKYEKRDASSYRLPPMFDYTVKQPESLEDAYDEAMEKFNVMESLALEVNNLSPFMSREDKVKEIRSRAIYYWNENLALLARVEQLPLTPYLYERNKKLVRYVKLRLQACELMASAIERNVNPQHIGLDTCEAVINRVIAEIRADDLCYYEGLDCDVDDDTGIEQADTVTALPATQTL